MRWSVVATLATTLVGAGGCGGKAREGQPNPRVIPSSGGATGSAAGTSGEAASGRNGGGGTGGTGLAGADPEPEVAGTNAGGAGTSGIASGNGGTGEASAGGPLSGAGQASTGIGATDTGGYGGTTGDAGSGNSASDGQAGEQGCIQRNGSCSCDWLAPTCEQGKDPYTGQQCPPTFAEISRVANWPLGGAAASEGMSCFPRGMSNGPIPSCRVDANGHWLMPPRCEE